MPTGKRVSSDVYRKEPETTEAKRVNNNFYDDTKWHERPLKSLAR
jgi:hypothetical protein